MPVQVSSHKTTIFTCNTGSWNVKYCAQDAAKLVI